MQRLVALVFAVLTACSRPVGDVVVRAAVPAPEETDERASIPKKAPSTAVEADEGSSQTALLDQADAIVWPDGMIAIPTGTVIQDYFPPGPMWPGDKVDVAAFAIDRTEVTVGAYSECVEAHGCSRPAKRDRLCNFGKKARKNHPINCVTHTQATEYCAWKGKRLPTQAEWQYAGRGSEKKIYPWGNDPPTCLGNGAWDDLHAGPARDWICWEGEGAMCDPSLPPPANYTKGTCEVGLFPKGASALGVLDLIGNVVEWTSSEFKMGWERPDGTRADGPAEPTFQWCGGGWKQSYDFDDARYMQLELSSCFPVAARIADVDVGFRCAVDANDLRKQ